jgi:hypothetical protein
VFARTDRGTIRFLRFLKFVSFREIELFFCGEFPSEQGIPLDSSMFSRVGTQVK